MRTVVVLGAVPPPGPAFDGDVRLVAVGPEFMALAYGLVSVGALGLMLLTAALVVLIGRR